MSILAPGAGPEMREAREGAPQSFLGRPGGDGAGQSRPIEHRPRVLVAHRMTAIQQALYELQSHEPFVFCDERELRLPGQTVELLEEPVSGYRCGNRRGEELLYDG